MRQAPRCPSSRRTRWVRRTGPRQCTNFCDACSTAWRLNGSLCAQVRALDLRRATPEEQAGDKEGSACRGRGVGPARRLGRGHGRLRARGLLRQREDGRTAVRAAGLAVSRNSLVTVASMASRESPQLPDPAALRAHRDARHARGSSLIFVPLSLEPSCTSSGRLHTARGGVPRGLIFDSSVVLLRSLGRSPDVSHGSWRRSEGPPDFISIGSSARGGKTRAACTAASIRHA